MPRQTPGDADVVSHSVIRHFASCTADLFPTLFNYFSCRLEISLVIAPFISFHSAYSTAIRFTGSPLISLFAIIQSAAALAAVAVALLARYAGFRCWCGRRRQCCHAAPRLCQPSRRAYEATRSCAKRCGGCCVTLCAARLRTRF